mmetsp:Transcript_28903/g.85422  ORF Transcript_28903/g.85422 Transcript_28903/m.85422 type:complete len:269 (+) Transcript_28903:624-1430(+)
MDRIQRGAVRRGGGGAGRPLRRGRRGLSPPPRSGAQLPAAGTQGEQGEGQPCTSTGSCTPDGCILPCAVRSSQGVQLRCRDSFPGRCIAEGRKGVRLGDGGGKEQRRHRAVRAAQSCHCHRGVARRQRGHGDVGLDRTIRRIVHLPARGATADPITEYGMLSQTPGGGDLSVLDQPVTANASARLRGEEFTEITWENRLGRRAHGCDGSTLTPVNGSINKSTVRLDGRNHRDHDVLFHLGLRQSALLVAHVHAMGCSTLAKFSRRRGM